MIAPSENALDFKTRIGSAVDTLVQLQGQVKDPVNAIFEKFNSQASKPIINSFKKQLALALETSERQLAMNQTAKINNVESEDSESEAKVKPE